MFESVGSLPAFAGCKLQNVSSSRSWLVYQSTSTELRLLEFAANYSLRETYLLDIPPEPIRAIRVVCDPEDATVYVGIAFISKFMLLRKNTLLTQFSLTLVCNIVDFEAGFAAVEGVHDGRQIYFVLTTCRGQIITCPVATPENKVFFQVEISARVTALCVREANAYLGTEEGQICWIDMNSRKFLGKYDSGSPFPLINIKQVKEYLLVGTCHGELHVVSANLERKRVISAHMGLVSGIAVEGSRVATVGDDQVIRVWDVEKEGVLSEVKQITLDKRVNMLFNLHGKICYNCYEESSFSEV